MKISITATHYIYISEMIMCTIQITKSCTITHINIGKHIFATKQILKRLAPFEINCPDKVVFSQIQS